jgi:Fe2+ transport system protein B
VRVGGEIIELVDLPGTYILEGGSPVEEQAARYLDLRTVDVIVNLADSTHWASALERNLELLPFKKNAVLVKCPIWCANVEKWALATFVMFYLPCLATLSALRHEL